MQQTKTIKAIELIEKDKQKHDAKIAEFESLLKEELTNDDKRAKLFLEIYTNACYDREIASILFTKGFTTMGSDQTDHITIGPILVKYVERMTKSNDQILELAKLFVEKKSHVNISKDDIFNEIQG